MKQRNPHKCPVPSANDGVFEVNDVVECLGCGQKWVLAHNFDEYGAHYTWHKLRWYHFKAQKLTRKA